MDANGGDEEKQAADERAAGGRAADGQASGAQPSEGRAAGNQAKARRAHRVPRRAIVLLIVAVVAIALAVPLVASCAPKKQSDEYQLAQAGTLTVASSLDHSLFDEGSADAASGFDIAVAHEVANRLGLGFSVVDVASGDVATAVADGTADAGVSCLTIGTDGVDKVTFSDPCYLADQALVVLKGTYETGDDLQGQRVVAPKRSAGYRYAESAFGKTTMGLADAATCFTALRSQASLEGGVRAVVVDVPVARHLLANGFADCTIIEQISTGEEYGIAVAQSNTALKDDINAALEDMDEDGTLDALRSQYLG